MSGQRGIRRDASQRSNHKKLSKLKKSKRRKKVLLDKEEPKNPKSKLLREGGGATGRGTAIRLFGEEHLNLSKCILQKKR